MLYRVHTRRKRHYSSVCVYLLKQLVFLCQGSVFIKCMYSYVEWSEYNIPYLGSSLRDLIFKWLSFNG